MTISNSRPRIMCECIFGNVSLVNVQRVSSRAQVSKDHTPLFYPGRRRGRGSGSGL